MVGFCKVTGDYRTQQHCELLVSKFGLSEGDFDTGVARLDMSAGKPNYIPPKPDGAVTEEEVFRQVIIYGEKEYKELVASIRETGEIIPTPFLDEIRKTGNDIPNDIPWLFKDIEKLKMAIGRAGALKKAYPQGGAKLMFGLYSMIMGNAPNGLAMEYTSATTMLEGDIDGYLDSRKVRCADFVTLFLGFCILIGVEPPDMVLVANDSNIQHLFIGLKDGGRYYGLDPSEGKKPRIIGPSKERTLARITKSELAAIQFSERMQKGLSLRSTPISDDPRIHQNAAWAVRYAPHLYTTLYGETVANYVLGNYAAAMTKIEETLAALPGLFPALTTKALLQGKLKQGP